MPPVARKPVRSPEMGESRRSDLRTSRGTRAGKPRVDDAVTNPVQVSLTSGKSSLGALDSFIKGKNPLLPPNSKASKKNILFLDLPPSLPKGNKTKGNSKQPKENPKVLKENSIPQGLKTLAAGFAPPLMIGMVFMAWPKFSWSGKKPKQLPASSEEASSKALVRFDHDSKKMKKRSFLHKAKIEARAFPSLYRKHLKVSAILNTMYFFTVSALVGHLDPSLLLTYLTISPIIALPTTLGERIGSKSKFSNQQTHSPKALTLISPKNE